MTRFFCKWDGERLRTTSLRTGTLVVLVNAAEAELDDQGGRWATVCDDHSTVVNHPTLRLAREWLHHPEDWCEKCMALESSQT